MTAGTGALVRRAYHVAEGDVVDVRGFIGLCHIGLSTMFAQMAVLPDVTSAVAASAPE